MTSSESDTRLLCLHPKDNVLILLAGIKADEPVHIEGKTVKLARSLSLGHKLARRSIRAGEKVLKHGAAIGTATRDIAFGEHVHLANLKSDYTPSVSLDGYSATGEEEKT